MVLRRTCPAVLGLANDKSIPLRDSNASDAGRIADRIATGFTSDEVIGSDSVPAKVVAQIMGHTKVDTTMNVYTQVLDGAARVAADRVGSELFRIVQIPDGTTTPTH